MLGAGRTFSVQHPSHAAIAQVRDIGHIVDHESVSLVQEVFRDLDAVLAGVEAVLLLSGDLAAVTAGAVVHVDQHRVFFHVSILLVLDDFSVSFFSIVGITRIK